MIHSTKYPDPNTAKEGDLEYFNSPIQLTGEFNRPPPASSQVDRRLPLAFTTTRTLFYPPELTSCLMSITYCSHTMALWDGVIKVYSRLFANRFERMFA